MADSKEKVPMIIRFKKVDPLAKDPKRGSEWSAGWDLTCVNFWYDPTTEVYVYHTGIAVELPRGYVGLLFPRSSIYRYTIFPTNSVGVIDADYRGEILFKFARRDCEYGERLYGIGERIGQLLVMPIPEVAYMEVETLSLTKRGTGGYGSSGL